MMGFGGFGGYAFPTRRSYSDPQSGQVLSDQEFTKSWSDKVNVIPQFVGGGEWEQAVAGQSGYSTSNNAVASTAEAARQNFERQAASAGWDQPKINQEWVSATNMGYIPGIANDGAISLSSNPYSSNTNAIGYQDAAGMGASHMVLQGAPTYTNPEWVKAKAEWDQAESQRSENQARQQQAYNAYLTGNGQIGGVMGSQYRNPAFGQVSGQKQGDVLTGMPGIGTGFGGITGVDDTSQTGAYTGGAGKYNPNPFAPGAFRNANPWA